MVDSYEKKLYSVEEDEWSPVYLASEAGANFQPEYQNF